ncbi:MAG: 7,8-didemethyl-8-hydroxy-5-deazariboflavin synthase subunit CofG [Chloroflexi bacterium]|nr:7,8-didemethyl-8-hydroxy-5-deazariboflavin synthase subunit CofG [Chloroflexota bacterium]
MSMSVPLSTPGSEEIAEILARAVEEPLSRDDGYRLMRGSEADVSALMGAAAAVRDRGTGRTVTYSRKVFIPLTNLCRDRCGYCTFAKPPSHAAARTMPPEEVLAVAHAGREQGCKEALFSLGEKPEERWAAARDQLRDLGYPSTIAYLAAMGERVHRETGLIPHANCGVLTRDELLALRDVNGSMGLMLESASERLLERGQAHFGCVGKAPETRLQTMATGGALGIAFTTGILVGIGETPEERVDALIAIRELHERSGNIQEVIVQNFRAKPDTRMRGWPEPSVLEMVRTIAVARLILGAEMNLQAPPNLAGGTDETQDVLSLYLAAGINDWGGISPVTKDHINPERAWPEIDALRQVTEGAGFVLRERLCLSPAYVRRPAFVRPRLAARIRAWTDATGLVKGEETRW